MAEIPQQPNSCDAIIVGAGIAGMYAVHRLRGMGFTVRGFERGDGVGGTWYWNRYPGARCDVESLDYSFSFSSELEQEWEWTERYPTQPELLRYFNHVADRFDIRRHFTFGTAVTSATYDEDAKQWIVATDQGDRVTGSHLIAAVGCLSTINKPQFKGLDNFTGDWYHTASWPDEGVDFTGKRVAVIGTGSTGIQLIPQVAKQADQLYVLQRTPNFSVPARNRPLDDAFQRQWKEGYQDRRKANRVSAFGQDMPANDKSAVEVSLEDAHAEMSRRWEMGGGAALMLSFSDLLINQDANDIVAEWVRNQIRTTVKDPETAELLCPTNHPIGCKRICVDIDYFDTYNRDNVKLIDVRTAPIEEITESGIRLADGTEVEVDAIVFATGFDAVTGTFLKMNITGRGGETLKDKWADGPHTYLGLMVVGFPNLYLVTGPNSPSVLSNMMISVEQHIDWITDTMETLRERNVLEIEPTQAAEEVWTGHCQAVANATLLPKANSWWMGVNIPGKPAVLLPYAGGVGLYRQQCDRVRDNGYEGFALDGEAVPLSGEDGQGAAVATAMAAAGA
jgi:cyclohexanone monooxygenase